MISPDKLGPSKELLVVTIATRSPAKAPLNISKPQPAFALLVPFMPARRRDTRKLNAVTAINKASPNTGCTGMKDKSKAATAQPATAHNKVRQGDKVGAQTMMSSKNS
nr:hypothetical protein [Alcaligenes sp. HPC1271]